MEDDSNNHEAEARLALTYPLTEEPGVGDGSAIEIAPGVLWLRLPLFASLPWINVWALADGDGWTIVDTGLRRTDNIDAWLSAFQGVLSGRPVTRVIATHMHPDHCGAAGWIVERFNARLWMTAQEYLTCRLLVADTSVSAPPDGVSFYRAAGWDTGAIDHYKTVFGSFGKDIYRLPDRYRRMRDGEIFAIGEHRWQVVVGSGHSPEHACLYCADLRLLISGDQVLPKISSNVSVFPTEPEANPLDDWLTSLAKVKDAVPADVLVLPAHNSPFEGLHRRIDHLIAGHRTGLQRLEELLAEPKRAVDVFSALFRRPINNKLLFMATGESLAHLNYLVAAGKASSELDADCVRWWRARG